MHPRWTIDDQSTGLENAKNIQYPVTIVAGQTIQQTLQMIQELPKIKKELDISDIKSLQTLFNIDKKIQDKYPYATIEGMLLPETYHYQLGDTDKQIILRAHQALQAKIDQALQSRNTKLQFKSKNEDAISKRLSQILNATKSLNPEFLNTQQGFNIKTNLEFPKNWGLGTSSTLINNIAQWANIDAFKFLRKKHKQEH